MKRLVLPLVVAIFCGPFIHCVKHRSVVKVPAAEVKVVDASGAPVPGAEVIVHWWSHPHAKLEQTYRFTADADGTVRLEEEVGSERIMPLCMHGVPQHEYTVCAGAAGLGWKAQPLEAKNAGTVTLTLPGGAYADECADHHKARFGN